MLRTQEEANCRNPESTFALAACGGGGDSGAADGGDSDTFAGGQTFTIKIGHSDTTTNLINVSLENFAKYVEEQSGGAVKGWLRCSRWDHWML